MTPPLPLDVAQRRLFGSVEPLPAEHVALERALGRYTAEDLPAARTQPSADLSAMDGYAVPGRTLAGPWRVIGESAAGHPFAGTLGPGEAVRISTGALMPAGAGAVLLQENAARDGDRLSLNGDGEPSPRHIRRAGFDFRLGDLLLPAGARLGPAQLALAIAGGHSEAPVHALPTLAVIDSGDELVAGTVACAAHQIPASNGPMLAAMAAPHTGSVRRIGPVPDKLDSLLAALGEAEEVDVIVTSGGASVGDHDLMRPALEAWGATIDFWRVAMKPGKPILVARRGPQWILGLPGNPVSSYVSGFLFLLPLLRKLAGAAHPMPGTIPFVLGEDLLATGDRLEFIRARQSGGTVVPVSEQDSSAQRALAASNALIRREIGAPAARRGELVQAYLLENGGIA
jgi:molybdopterin molybdotransferase